jgi:TatA/E family protein of Tat protein translocase
MAFDDPVVWVLIIAIVVFMFGSSKIPGLARALGQARREFDAGWKGLTTEKTEQTTPAQS